MPVPAAQADLDAALARQARPSAAAPETPSAPAQVAPPEPLPAPVDNAPAGALPPAAIDFAPPVPADKVSAPQVPPVAAGSPPPDLPEPAPVQATPSRSTNVSVDESAIQRLAFIPPDSKFGPPQLSVSIAPHEGGWAYQVSAQTNLSGYGGPWTGAFGSPQEAAQAAQGNLNGWLMTQSASGRRKAEGGARHQAELSQIIKAMPGIGRAATPGLPEPAPLAAPAQTSGVNQAPTSGDTIAKPGFGGAPDVAPAAPAGKPAITLPDAATAQTWASRNADRFKSVTIRENPAGGFDVFTVAKGSKLAFGARPDGGTDIIDLIQSLGGVPPPPKGATGGEWDGFGEVFAGPAKLLVNAKKRGLGLDQFLGNFSDTEFAHLAGNPDGFKQTVSDALAERARLKIANTLEENTAKFQTAILTGKGRGGKEPKAGQIDRSDNLNPGDKFSVKGEPITVTDVDPDGNVVLQDGPRFGTQIIPPGVEIYPDARSLKKLPRETPKASTAPQSDDPFGDNYVPEPDVPAAPPAAPTQADLVAGIERQAAAPALTLESASVGQQAAEAQAAREAQLVAKRRADMLAANDRPLTGDSSNVNQGQLYAEDADMFSGASAQEVAARPRLDNPGEMGMVREDGSAPQSQTPGPATQPTADVSRAAGSRLEQSAQAQGPAVGAGRPRRGLKEIEAAISRGTIERDQAAALFDRALDVQAGKDHWRLGMAINAEETQQLARAVAAFDEGAGKFIWPSEALRQKAASNRGPVFAPSDPYPRLRKNTPFTDHARSKVTPSAGNAESGAIAPEVMRAVGFAAARGAAGAAVGTLLADTPEERAGYALAGGLLGVSASPALAKMLGRAAFSTTSVGRRAFPEATIPFDLREQLILKSGAVAATGHRGNNAQRALEVALRKEADPSAAAYEVWQFLTAKIPGVRPSLAAPATEARAALDELSDKLILSGLATGTLADTITAGKGSYLRRAFRIFQSPGWRPEQKVIDDWQAAYLAANPNKTAQDAQDLALELLDRRNAEEFVMTGSLLRQNRDAFKPRKNLDAPTLALLGEITEPVELLGQTVPRMARLVETHETQKNLARIGQAMGHFSAQSDLSRGHIVQLAKDADAPAVGPLAGLWTTPELREALEAATAGQSEQSLVWRTLAGATTLAKFSKTVLNPESWVPNGIGAFIDGVKNGNLRIMANGPAWKDALAVSTEELGFNPQGPAGRAATAALYAKMQRLGLAGQGSSADFQRGLEMAWGETTQRGAKRTMLAFGRGYAFSENVMRYMNFRAEVERYRLAFPLMSPAELDAHAARVVRATTTNYAMIPETVRKASTAGLLGTFVNFPYEQFRHAYNMARIARDDLAQGAATGNQALVKAGASRLAALLAAAAGTGAVAAWSMRKEGISPEQDAAYRRRFAPWDRNQSLIYQGRDGDNIAYMSQSYVNPQAVLLGGGMAAARGESLEEAAMNFLKNGQETFGGGSVLLNPGLETLLNRTERGRQISSPEDSAAKQANDRISYLADRAYSPGFLNSLSRFAKGYKGEAGPDGQVYTLGDAAQRLIGRRINRVNLPYRFEREAFDMNRRLAEVHSSYASVRRREEVNAPEKVDAAYQISEQRRQVVFKDLAQYIADARVLGYDEEKTVGWLRKGGVPAEIALGALEGRYVPGERLHAKTGAELLAEIRAKPAAEHLSAFVAEVTKNPAFISTIKGAMLDEARGVTQRDKLVAALDPEKRAAYIRLRMGEQSETQRLEYLHELGRKRLLTPETVRQIVKPK